MEFVVGLVMLVAMCLVAGVLLKGADMLQAWRYRLPPQEVQRRAAEFTARLATPAWAALEQHFGARAPDDLRYLYENPLHQAEHLRIPNPSSTEPDREEYIAWFLPADLKTVDEVSWVVSQGDFPFADDGSNNYYSVKFGPDPTQPSTVHLHWHDGGDVEAVATNLREFLSRATPRQAKDAESGHAAQQ